MTSDTLVSIAPGIVVPLAAAALAVDLEARGITLELENDCAVIIAAGADRVTDADRVALHAHGAALVRILRHAAQIEQ